MEIVSSHKDVVPLISKYNRLQVHSDQGHLISIMYLPSVPLQNLDKQLKSDLVDEIVSNYVVHTDVH